MSHMHPSLTCDTHGHSTISCFQGWGIVHSVACHSAYVTPATRQHGYVGEPGFIESLHRGSDQSLTLSLSPEQPVLVI